MSIKAYKLIEIATEKNPTFDLDNAIIEKWLFCEISDACGGILCIQKDYILEPLEDADIAKEYGFGQEEIEIARKMLKDCGDKNFVEYWCG